jgi:hypothetical protein
MTTGHVEYALDFSHARTIQEIADITARELYSSFGDEAIVEMIELGKALGEKVLVKAMNVALQNMLDRRRLDRAERAAES